MIIRKEKNNNEQVNDAFNCRPNFIHSNDLTHGSVVMDIGDEIKNPPIATLKFLTNQEQYFTA